MRKITLDGWKLFSDRRNSKNYMNDDGTRVLKTSSSENTITEKQFESEIENCKAVAALGIPTPMCLEVVEVEGEGAGLITECIKNKKSISRAISEDLSNMEMYIKKFVDMEKLIHSTKCNTSFFPSFESRLDWVIKNKNFLNEQEAKIVKDYYETIPKSETCLHIDCQFGNIITDGNKEYLIDLGLFSYGNELFDIAILNLFTSSKFLPEALQEKTFHMNRADLNKCWKLFLKHYYNIITEQEILDFEKKIDPITFISLLVLNMDIDAAGPTMAIKEALFDKLFKK